MDPFAVLILQDVFLISEVFLFFINEVALAHHLRRCARVRAASVLQLVIILHLLGPLRVLMCQVVRIAIILPSPLNDTQ